jgi:hypothetical protein
MQFVGCASSKISQILHLSTKSHCSSTWIVEAPAPKVMIIQQVVAVEEPAKFKVTKLAIICMHCPQCTWIPSANCCFKGFPLVIQCVLAMGFYVLEKP